MHDLYVAMNFLHRGLANVVKTCLRTEPAMLQCVLLVAWFLLLWRFPGCSFSAAKQGPLRLLREKAGLELRTKVNNPNMTYSDEARVLLGNWSNVRKLKTRVSCYAAIYATECPVLKGLVPLFIAPSRTNR